MLERQNLVVYVKSSQHRWEKHGDEDRLAVDVQVRLNSEDDWLDLLVDLLGWTRDEISAFLTATGTVYDKDVFHLRGGYEDHNIAIRTVVGNRVLIAGLASAKINKFGFDLADGHLNFRLQATIPSESVASDLIKAELGFVSLDITGPPQQELGLGA